MTITAEQIADAVYCDAKSYREAESAAQSILDELDAERTEREAIIRAEATAAAYGAAGDMIEDDCSFMSAHQIMRAVQALTPADATAWLAARDALHARHDDDRQELNRMTAENEALQARVNVLQDVASIAGDRLKEVLMSSDFAQSDPGYPAAIRSICDKIDALMSKGSPDANA